MTTHQITDLQRHHYQMISNLASAQPPRIGKTECICAEQLEDLADHMQRVANAFLAYAHEVIREFCLNSELDGNEVEHYMYEFFCDAIEPMCNAVETKRGEEKI